MVIANPFYHWRASQWEEMVTNWGVWLTVGSIIFSHLWLTSLLRSRTGLLLLDLSSSLFKFKICVGKVFSLFYLNMYIVKKTSIFFPNKAENKYILTVFFILPVIMINKQFIFWNPIYNHLSVIIVNIILFYF